MHVNSRAAQAGGEAIGHRMALGFRIIPADSKNLPPAPLLGLHWLALHAVVADGFAIIELLHDDGSRAEWFFDGAGQHSNDMGAWPAKTHDALRTAFRPAVTALRDALLPTFPLRFDPTQTAALHDFLRLGPGLRDTIVSALQAELLPDPIHCNIDAPGAAMPSWADPAALRQTLSANLQNRFVAAMREGGLVWPSPVDGADMPCTGALTLDDFNSLFRFFDRASGLDVFVLATEHMSRVAGLYVPGRGAVVSLGGDQARMLRQHFGNLGRYVLHHLAHFAESLFAGQAQPAAPCRFATFLHPGTSAHLGHQLWNELAAIDALVDELPQDRMPQWLVAGLPNHGIEFYGPIDALFPEIAGRVCRGFVDQRALIRHAYENRLVLFRATREHVGDGLRRRIMAHAACHAPAVRAASRILLIGLRVENRTVTDLGALCALVIEEAMRLHPGCTVVFDGHNARGDTRSDETITSHREAVASQSPLAVERGVVAAMQQRFAGQPVTLLDTLGEPLAVSLAWSQACDGFVALWGAGLAKYRWVANRPGLILTSCWNLEHRGDLHLYDVEDYMESPTPLVFVPGDVMLDLPSAPMLVPAEEASYKNFTFDPDAMRTHVRRFLAALDGPPGALAALTARSKRHYGFVDLVDTAVYGWAICEGECPAALEVIIDGVVVGQVVADMPRPDLPLAGFSTATAGFRFVLPAALLDGVPRTLAVRYGDGGRLPMLSPNTADPFAFRLGGAEA